MKRQTNFLIYIMLAFALIAISVAGTLALIADSESKVGNILQFEKVSICGHYEGGSNLQIVLDEDKAVYNGAKILDEENYFFVRPTDDTMDCFLRVRFYFTLNDDVLDEENKATLDILNNGGTNGRPLGLSMYNGNAEWGYVSYEGYNYLVLKDENALPTETLKVVKSSDFATGFIIANEYELNFDTLNQDAIVALDNEHSIYLKAEVEAMQCLNVSKVLNEAVNGTENVILSQGTESAEETYGFASIKDFHYAGVQNLMENSSSGLPKVAKASLDKWTWKEISAASRIIERANELKVKELGSVMVDKVKVSYIVEGTLGVKGYNQTFAFDEMGIQNKISLRDKKTFKLSKFEKTDTYGEQIELVDGKVEMIAMVSAFLHDTKVEDSKPVGITFTTENCYSTLTMAHYKVNWPDSNSGYYGTYSYYIDRYNYSSKNPDLIKVFLQGLLLQDINKVLGEETIVKVKKCNYYYSNGGKTLKSSDWVWPLSYAELGVTGNSYTYYELTSSYPVYYSTNEQGAEANANRKKLNSEGVGVDYHTRSSPPSYSNATMCCVRYDGYALKHDGYGRSEYRKYHDELSQIAFGFCV